MTSKNLYSGFITSLEADAALALDEAMKVGKPSFKFTIHSDLSFMNDEDVVIFSGQGGQNIIKSAGLVKKISSQGFSTVLEVTDFVPFNPALTLMSFGPDAGWIADLVSKNFSGRRLNAEEWGALLGWIKLFIRNRKNTREQFERLLFNSIKQDNTPERLNKIIRLSEQKDALKLTLELAGFNNEDLDLSINHDEYRIKQASSVLDLLGKFKVQERSILESDARIVKAFLGSDFTGGTLAKSDTASARVFISDKTPIELALGVDLLIYQPHYHSFILIQYKCLEFGVTTKKWIYRPDNQLISQVTQIGKINKVLNAHSPKIQAHSDFRMNANPFYFKFCERRQGDLDRSALSPGLTIGVDYLVHHLKNKVNGGRYDYISYEKMPRNMSNDHFVSLARDGWIGSQSTHTEIIFKLLQEYDLKGRNGIVAIVDRLSGFDM